MAGKRDTSQKIIDAALDLAAAGRWRDLELADIAEAAGISETAVAGRFADKTDIMIGFMAATDREVAKRAGGEDLSETGPRDRLFDVIMTRFEVLAPHRAALATIVAAMERDRASLGRLLLPVLNAQSGLLDAAGITAAPHKIAGLAVAYGSVFRTWLNDDDPGLARTMAALDRTLRRGEGLLKQAQLPLSVMNAAFDFARGWRRARASRDAGAAPPNRNGSSAN
jgi:AcrR family transcriptional regulator